MTTKQNTTRPKGLKLEILLRHTSGLYWVCAKVNGKSVLRHLETTEYYHLASLPSTARAPASPSPRISHLDSEYPPG